MTSSCTAQRQRTHIREKIVPFIRVEILEGRTMDQRRRFVEAVTRAAVDCLEAKPERVRILFEQLKPEDLARNGVLVIDDEASGFRASGAVEQGAQS